MLSSVFLFGVLLLCAEVKAHCLYNGTVYKVGDELPTRESCLHCVCKEDFTKPSIDQCKIIDCAGPCAGDCTPIYQEGECCAVSWRCNHRGPSGVIPIIVPSTTAKCNCAWRFYQHYKVKNCKPVFENGFCCPVRFECPDKVERDQTVCHFKGKAYQPGEEINDPSFCGKCTCRPRDGAAPEINCYEDGCGFTRDPRLDDPRCYEVFEEGACCASGIKCRTDDSLNKTTEPICMLDGRVYHHGQEMYPEGMPCVTCYCNEKWTGLHGSTCHKRYCEGLDFNFKYLEQGCIPIYHEATCCPIEYHCKTGEEEIIPKTKSLTPDVDSKDVKNKCKFDGKFYNLGDVLDIKNPRNCVTCTCKTPPDFMCIHKSCPNPPNNDFVNCTPNFVKGECCPTYACVY